MLLDLRRIIAGTLAACLLTVNGCDGLALNPEDETPTDLILAGLLISSGYALGGTATGLSGAVVLSNTDGATASPSSNGSFFFDRKYRENSAYSVSISSIQTFHTCSLSNASGTFAQANVTNIGLSCVNKSYTVGGSRSGPGGGTINLRNNGGDNLAVAANGAFAFPTSIQHPGAYNVTVFSTASALVNCSVASGSGNIAGANVTNVSVVCGLCGDGVVQGGEACDDGNTTPGDGCNATCSAVEAGFTCTGSLSVCTAI